MVVKLRNLAPGVGVKPAATLVPRPTGLLDTPVPLQAGLQPSHLPSPRLLPDASVLPGTSWVLAKCL